MNLVGLELPANRRRRRPPAHLDCVSPTQRHCGSATETLCGVYTAQTHPRRLQMKNRVLLKNLELDWKIQIKSRILTKMSRDNPYTNNFSMWVWPELSYGINFYRNVAKCWSSLVRIRPKSKNLIRTRSVCLRLGPYSARMDPTGSGKPLGCFSGS